MRLIPLLIVGYLLFGLFIYSLLTMASDTEDEMEEMLRQKKAEDAIKLNK